MAHILFVSHTSELGGPNYRLLHLIEYLVEHNHKPYVIAPGNGNLFSKLANLPVSVFPAGSRGLKCQAIPWLYQIITREKIDIVYGNNFSSGTRNTLIAARLARRPYIWHINEMLDPERGAQFNRTYFLRFADALIADSIACTDSVQVHVPNKKVHQIYNGIDLGAYDLDRESAKNHIQQSLGLLPGQTVVTSAANLCHRKGQAYGVAAAIKVLDEYPDTAFVFLGETHHEMEYAKSLIKRVSQANKSDKILFPGFRDDLPEILSGSDVFLHTAVKDPQPIAVLAAMAARLPVIAFSVDGVAEEVIHNQTGNLIDAGDIESLTRALVVYIKDSDLRTQQGIAGRLRVEESFSADKTSQSITEVINNTLVNQ